MFPAAARKAAVESKIARQSGLRSYVHAGCHDLRSTFNAGMAEWSGTSLPSCEGEFDSRCPLQLSLLPIGKGCIEAFQVEPASRINLVCIGRRRWAVGLEAAIR